MSKSSSAPEDVRELIEDLDRTRSLFKTINDFALKLMALPSEEELVWYVARQVVGRLGFDDCVIYLIDPKEQLLRQVAAIGSKNPEGNEIVNALRIPVGQGITGRVAASAKPVIVDDLNTDPDYIPDVEPALSEICVPLIIDDLVVGVIDCEDPRPAYFDEEHLEILSTVAAMTSARLKITYEARDAATRNKELRRLNDRLQQEVAERTAAEALAERSATQLQSILDNSPAMICLKDAGGRYLLANRRFEAFFGTATPDIAGRTSAEVLPPDLADIPEAMDQQVLRTGAPTVVEQRIMHHGGEHIVLTNKFPILDAAGTLTGIGTLGSDITELRRAETLLTHAMNAMPAVFVLFDAEDRLVFCNQQYRDMYETEAVPAVPGARFEDIVRGFAEKVGVGDTAEATAQWVARRLERRGGGPAPQRYKRGDGEWIESTDHILEDGSILTIGLIVTEQVFAEEAKRQAQKMEAVGQLTGGVAHDFNNLLAAIQGNAELLAESPTDGAGSIDAILQAAERGAELTQRLLAFSRRQPLQPRATDLARLVAGMSALLARTLGETIEVKVRNGPDLWPAMADPGQVESALLNLAINARDAMPGGGLLTIECVNTVLDEAYVARNAEAATGEYVMLAVGDSGTGMSPEVMSHAFEPFFTTKDVGAGSGLGLSMVYGFAKQSGGHVKIDSAPGEGTTVRIYLPRSVANPASVSGRSEVGLPVGRNEIVMVVEDNPGVREMVTSMLKRLHYRVIKASDAAAGLELLAGEPVDLVLTDVVLGSGMSGAEFAEVARDRHPDLKIVFMSGYVSEAAERDRLGSDAATILRKPFKVHQVAEALRAALDRDSA